VGFGVAELWGVAWLSCGVLGGRVVGCGVAKLRGVGRLSCVV